MATSNAVAVWEGKLKDGKGSFKAQSGVFSGSFSFGTRAAVTLEMVDGAPKVTRSALEVRGKVDGIDDAAFRQAAEAAKKNCPLSKAIQGNVEITMDAKLA